MEISAENLKFCIQFDESSDWKLNTATEKTASGVEFLHIVLHTEKPSVPPKTEIKWEIPNLDIQTRWSPVINFNKNIPADWSSSLTSNLASSAPVMAFLNLHGENRMTFAVSEAMRPVQFAGGVNEERNQIICKVILFSQPDSPLSEYKTTIRIDRRNIYFADSIRDVTEWFAGFEEYTPSDVPAQALKPIYSTWYSYHQNLFDKELEAECALASAAGLSGIIVDDGWQTDDNNRGYAFCGDWKIAERRFPDMKAHVKKIHDFGMKYLLWYSVPFMGYKSENYQRFKGKYLFDFDRMQASVLDPRFPEVREYLVNIYETAIREWDLDGFKLDFIDSFRFDGIDPAIAEDYAGRDIKSLPLAVNRLLSDVMERLKMIKPEILIEFRQSYIGPAIRKYGNIFRAADCPADILANRVRIIDLRLFSGNTAVHSDMLEWNMEETAETAALQILNVIFSVPQISIRFGELPENHRKMLGFWLDFTQQHKEVLLKGKFMPYHPEANYPVVSAENEQEKVIAVYQSGVAVNAATDTGQLFIINAGNDSEMILDFVKAPSEVVIFNTFGEAVNTPVFQQGLNKVTVPRSGLVQVKF